MLLDQTYKGEFVNGKFEGEGHLQNSATKDIQKISDVESVKTPDPVIVID